MTVEVKLLLKPLEGETTKFIRLYKYSTLGLHRLFFKEEEIAKHGAILVGNYIFCQYSQDGLAIKYGDEAREFADNFDEEDTCDSTKTVEAFEEWVNSSEVRDKYRARKYLAGSNNCIHFVQDACEFLEIDLPEAFEKILKFCKENAGGLNLSGAGSSGSSSSSK